MQRDEIDHLPDDAVFPSQHLIAGIFAVRVVVASVDPSRPVDQYPLIFSVESAILHALWNPILTEAERQESSDR